MVIEEYDVHNLDCPDCGAKIEAEINNLEEVESANLDFINKHLTIEYIEKVDNPLKRLNAIASKIDPNVQFTLAGLEQDGKKAVVYYCSYFGADFQFVFKQSFLSYFRINCLSYCRSQGY